MKQVTNILIVGTGGQGVILASDILTDVMGNLDHIEVKKTETHGMSQRGGSVHAQIRYGQKVDSPYITPGEANVILAFEEAEGLRYSHYMDEAGGMILNSMQIIPPLVNTGLADYPTEAINELKKRSQIKSIDALKIATEIGNEKVVSVVLLGALASMLEFKDEVWTKVIKSKVPPKAVEANIKAFTEGKNNL